MHDMRGREANREGQREKWTPSGKIIHEGAHVS